MVTRRLLDSNVWIDVWKNPSGSAAATLQRFQPADLVSCSIVRAELLHGAQKYGNAQRRVAMVRAALSAIASISFDDMAADYYADIKHDLELKGCIIGPADLQIAAICLAHQLTLVSGNVREFSRVSGLSVEDWTAGSS